jgi:hypothetical protein
VHFPFAHDCPAPHAAPHAPQSVGLDLVSMQPLPQVASPVGQVNPHFPPLHVATPRGGALHALPQSPHEAGLLVTSWQTPLHDF